MIVLRMWPLQEVQMRAQMSSSWFENEGLGGGAKKGIRM